MVKKLFLLLVLSLFLLSACGKDSGELLDDDFEAVDELVDEIIDSEPEVVDEPELVDEESFASESSEDYSLSDLLIERSVRYYSFISSDFVEKVTLLGTSFNSYQAVYSYAGSEAVVSVLVLPSKNDYSAYNSFISKLKNSNDFIVLDSEDFNYLKNNIYMNPSENVYLWLSDDKVLMISGSVGTDLLEFYLDKYFVSEVHGFYSNTEVEFEVSKNNPVLLFYDGDKYFFKFNIFLDGELSMLINDETTVFNIGREKFFDNLLLEVKTVDKVKDVAVMKILDSVSVRESFNLDINDVFSFELDGETYNFKLLSADSEDSSVRISVNDRLKTIVSGETVIHQGLNINLESLFISNIGDKKVYALFNVWI